MKLSWRDFFTAVFGLFGAAIVVAKIFDYSWIVISDSWRSAIAVLGITGLIMAIINGFDTESRSIVSTAEIALAIAAVGVGIAGLFVASATFFYVLAGLIGGLWLLEVSRHVWHSVMDDTTTYGSHVAVH